MGYAVSEVPERHFCCGSAGTYNMLQPKIAATLGQRKAKNIESTAPQFVVAGNLGCITQIAAHTHLPVVHTIEAVDWAMGGPLPPALIGHDLVEPQEDYLTEVASGTSDVGNEQGGVIW
jgi:glycolate oxidase iron-sulfur subunit